LGTEFLLCSCYWHQSERDFWGAQIFCASLITRSRVVQPVGIARIMGSNPARRGASHGQPRQARPRSKEAEKGQGQTGAREITVRTPSGETYGPKHAACA
jgi:hypothetical protein